MLGLMMDMPLTITSTIEFAAANHGGAEIVSRTNEGPLHRYTFAGAHDRIRKLANALTGMGVKPGDRVATLAWNGYRHVELYYAISGIGAICHTVNPRLFKDQLIYIFNHAEDRIVFIDPPFVPLVEELAGDLAALQTFVIMAGEADMPDTTLNDPICYETLIADEPASFDWPAFSENTASALCYTSGTTGNPKGALYSHRSTILHSMSACTSDSLAIASWDTIMPIVPMFHVNAWGLPYCAAMTGARLVLPGAKMDPASLYELLDGEKVTFSGGVPTVWLALLDHLAETGAKLEHLERIVVGGAAAPRTMIETLENDHGVEVMHAWGMTEMSPIGTTGRLDGAMRRAAPEKRIDTKTKQGRPIYGVELKITGPEGETLAHDGAVSGDVRVRGPWVINAYYNDAEATEQGMDADGWLQTGDVAVIGADGILQIVDRTKDVIKTGGEWLSSIDIENAAIGHPDIAEAGVIAAAHPKWGERPLLIAVLRDGAAPSVEAVLEFMRDKLEKLAWPDDVVFVDELPHTATGKISKIRLREQFKDYKLPGA